MRTEPTSVLFSALLVGCGAAVHLPSPASTGTLAPTQARYVSSLERSAARQLSLPTGTYTDTATLVRLDGEQVCFDIVTRLTQSAGSGDMMPYVTLDPTSMHLAYDGGSLDSPTLDARPVSRQSLTGQSMELYREPEDNMEIHGAITAVNLDLVSAGGVACFAHHGRIPASNRHLRLTYTQFQFTPTFEFALDASSPPGAWPAHPIVASGYERLAQ